MNKIGVFIGTRPELIKCLPLIKSSDIYVPIFVQQHSDILDISNVNEYHMIPITSYGDNRLNNIIMSIMNSNIINIEWHAILVQGDTAVAFAAAVSAFHRNIKIIHLEAGLRTYDLHNPWPEEGYRRMIDAITNIALCPSNDSAQNLVNENFKGDIQVVGNTSIDAIHNYNLTPKIGDTVIITLHRRENWHQIQAFFEVIEELATIHTNLKFILPIHPNPDIKKLATIFRNVNVINPLPHAEICKLLADCNCIISDSGGIQEEAGFLGKRVFCCRKVTERTDLIDMYITYTPTPESLRTIFTPQTNLLPRSMVYGEGDAYLKINSYLTNIICLK